MEKHIFLSGWKRPDGVSICSTVSLESSKGDARDAP
jgi:hypothetical protein